MISACLNSNLFLQSKIFFLPMYFITCYQNSLFFCLSLISTCFSQYNCTLKFTSRNFTYHIHGSAETRTISPSTDG